MTTFAEGRLRDAGVAVLEQKVAELNKRARKLGLTEIEVRRVHEELVEGSRDPVTGIVPRWRVTHVEVRGDAPRVEGWMVAAKIEFTEGGNLLSAAPGIGDINPEYRTVENRCDHCNCKRRRNTLVVIRHEDGREMVVGRNCLADYLRTQDAEALLAYGDLFGSLAEMMSECEGEQDNYRGGSGGAGGYLLTTLLEAASVCIRKLGWVSRTKAREQGEWARCTADDVIRLLKPPSIRQIQDYRDWVKWVEDNGLVAGDIDMAEVVKAYDYLATIPEAAPSDYEHNLRVLGLLSYIPCDKIGLSVSILPASKRYHDEELKRRTAKEKGPREFYGTVGERFRGLAVKVIRTRSFRAESYGGYGHDEGDVKTIITFGWERGELTWFASGDQTEAWEVESEHVIDATVKQHKTDPKFGNATMVNRVSIHVTAAEKKAAAKAKRDAKKAEAAQSEQSATA